MSETMRLWIEMVFNVIYVIVVWSMVACLWRRRTAVAPDRQAAARRLGWAFGLLALGDTGHVGFRVLAYASGNLEMTVRLFGNPVSLVSLGTFATSVTVTLFYVMMVFVWRERFQKRIGRFEWVLFAAAAARLVMLFLPQNEWAGIDSPYPWSIYRNIPLLVQGLGVTWLILRDAVKARDRTFLWIGAMILVSYACYTPVLFLARQYPLVSLLMMPKTLAYLAVAFIAYFDLYPKRQIA
jgi:hypothetical protein